jgi:thiol-disulfide isomerase/thioredoxin
MKLTSNELKSKIESGIKMVVKFESSWCGPCKAMKPMFDKASKQVKEQNSNVEYYVYDVESDKDFTTSLGIRSIPTIKVFNKGEEVFSKTGVMRTEELVNLSTL